MALHWIRQISKYFVKVKYLHALYLFIKKELSKDGSQMKFDVVPATNVEISHISEDVTQFGLDFKYLSREWASQTAMQLIS